MPAIFGIIPKIGILLLNCCTWRHQYLLLCPITKDINIDHFDMVNVDGDALYEVRRRKKTTLSRESVVSFLHSSTTQRSDWEGLELWALLQKGKQSQS